MILLLRYAVAIAHAGCPASGTSLTAYVAAGARGWESRAPLEVVAARDEARAAVACLDDVPTPAQAAAVHGLEAMDAFLQRDLERARASARAALSADPHYQLPVALVAGHPFQQLFDEARAAPPDPTTPLEPVAGRAWMLDGASASDRPTGRPVILQLTGDGRVFWSALLAGEAATPDLAHLAETRPRRGAGLALSGVTGGLAIGAATLFGVGSASAERYRDPATPMAELDGLRRRTNTLGTAAGAAGLAALGAGVLTVVVVVR